MSVFIDPNTFNHRSELLSTGKRYHFVDEKPRDFDPASTTTIICVHGFPDFWYGWRHQISPWRDAGCRVVVPDMLGYGGTDKPVDISDYGTKSLSNDIAALLDLLEVRKAVVIGHDWGAATVWRFALYHPERVLSLVCLSVPYFPPSPTYASLEDIVKTIPNYGYQLYFADPSSTNEINENLTNFYTILFQRPRSMEGFTRVGQLRDILLNHPEKINKSGTVLSAEELSFYVEQAKLAGMQGPLSYYKTTDQRFKEEKQANLQTSIPSSFPVLFMFGSKDGTCPKPALASMDKFVPRLTKRELQGDGHWVLVEAKEEVIKNVLDFIQGKLGKGQSQAKL